MIKPFLKAFTASLALAAPALAPAQANDAMPLPADATDLETQVYGIFEQHCARCHQDGALEDGLANAKSGFGHVLDIRRLANDPKFVVPGQPVGSKLYDAFGQFGIPRMPDDCGEDYTCYPSFEDSEVLKNWIVALGEAAPEPRPVISLAKLHADAFADLQAQPTNRRDRIRYISLREIHNDPAVTDANFDAYRMATLKLLNALSWNPLPFRAEPVDEAGVLIRVFLPDLDWDHTTWHLLEAEYTYGMTSETDRYLTPLQNMAGTKIPIIRADWFAAHASVSPMYYDILGLPDTLQGLEALLGIDMIKNILDEQVVRAGFLASGVSTNNRLLERHALGSGFFWTSYDFAGSVGRQSFFRFPLGPEAVHGPEHSFHSDGGESIFTLPNGFHAYYLNTEKGERLNVGPTAIVRDDDYSDGSGEVVNGISCFSCHINGMRFNEDEVREVALADLSLPATVRQTVDAIYPGQEVVDMWLQKDAADFKATLANAGLDPETTAAGMEPIRGLFVYHVDYFLGFDQAASELGLTPDEMRARIAYVGPDLANLITRLDRTRLPRDEWTAAFPILLAQLTDYEPVIVKPIDTTHLPYSVKTVVDLHKTPDTPVVHKPDTTPPIHADANYSDPVNPDPYVPTKHSNPTISHLTVYTEYPSYKVGDRVKVFIEPKFDCQLTLISIDDKKRSCVIFPHPDLDNSPIKGGTRYVFPPVGGLRTTEAGQETILAICNADPKALSTDYRDLSRVSCDPNYREVGYEEINTGDVIHEMLLFDPNDDEQTGINGADYTKLSTQNPYVAQGLATITVTHH